MTPKLNGSSPDGAPVVTDRKVSELFATLRTLCQQAKDLPLHTTGQILCNMAVDVACRLATDPQVSELRPLLLDELQAFAVVLPDDRVLNAIANLTRARRSPPC